MVRITVDLIRKRAEHNEGRLSTLKEVSLHQQNIERIEGIGNWCKELEILYLQNNVISRLEKLNKLKDLTYLNVAINNISYIRGLERCEFLAKLDLTMNFIDAPRGLLSMEKLKANDRLVDIYMTGNPCCEYQGWREFVIGSLPTLQRIDGATIKPSERIVARQKVVAIREKLLAEVKALGLEEGGLDDVLSDVSDDEDDVDFEYVNNNDPQPWNKKTRLRDARQQDRENAEQEEKRKANQQGLFSNPPKPRREGFDPLPEEGGRVFQKNEGQWDYTLDESEDGKELVLDIAIGKYLATELIQTDVRPELVRLLIKGKLFQIVLPEAVMSDQASAARSKISGHLVLTMPKAKPNETLVAEKARIKREKELAEFRAAQAGATKGNTLDGFRDGRLHTYDGSTLAGDFGAKAKLGEHNGHDEEEEEEEEGEEDLSGLDGFGAEEGDIPPDDSEIPDLDC